MAFDDGDKGSVGVQIPIFAPWCSRSFGKLAGSGINGDI
jgi:hypothetical protein